MNDGSTTSIVCCTACMTMAEDGKLPSVNNTSHSISNTDQSDTDEEKHSYCHTVHENTEGRKESGSYKHWRRVRKQLSLPKLTHTNSSNSFRAQRFPDVVRTFQIATSWKKKAETTSPTPRVDSFLERFEMGGPGKQLHGGVDLEVPVSTQWIVDPSRTALNNWLILVTLAVLYNFVFIIARCSFHQLHKQLSGFWFVMDYLCDAIYLADMFVQFRTGYLERGILVTDVIKLRRRYFASNAFKLDCVSVLPFDLLYIGIGSDQTALRLLRLLRLHRVITFLAKAETSTSHPSILRIFSLTVVILLVFHWNACFYFLISQSIGLGSDNWVYPSTNGTGYDNLARQYLYSFYWSALIMTTGENQNQPETDTELLFVIADILLGYLVFAALVGQFGSMITQSTTARREFNIHVEAIKRYMTFRGVEGNLKKRVIAWLDYKWSKEQSLDELQALQKLPDKLRAELAMNVYLKTLKAVEIFSDCEPGLLRDLVLKLRPQVFSPGDYICRKGDVGKSLYIVSSGCLRVVADDGVSVVATLSEGSYFGEISILNLSGVGNRRTANVRSVGFTDLLYLSKEDLLSVLTEYPDARKKLEDQGRKLLRRSR